MKFEDNTDDDAYQYHWTPVAKDCIDNDLEYEPSYFDNDGEEFSISGTTESLPLSVRMMLARLYR